MSKTNHTVPCESAKTVPKMKSLTLFLFLGATAALAEIHVDNDPDRNHIQGFGGCLRKCFGGSPTMPAKLADEENDPRHPHRRFLHGLLNCIRECISEHRPTISTPPPTEPGKVADVNSDPRRPHPSFGPERKKCIRKCLEEYKPSNMPSNIPELADEENDPDRANPTTPRPTFSPELEKCIEHCMEE